MVSSLCLFLLSFYGGMGGKEIGEPHYDGGAPHATRAEDRRPRTGFLEKLCGKIAAAAVIHWITTCSGIKKEQNATMPTDSLMWNQSAIEGLQRQRA